MASFYKTIAAPARGFFSDKKSKFYSFVYPVDNEEVIRDILKKLRKEYHSARHYVYAFRLGADKSHYRYSDDGEPSGSAGLPVFNVIKSEDLTNILIVVVRYFGGKKLGIPGLINAYSTSAMDAIKNANIVIRKITKVFELSFPYSLLGSIMKFIEQNEGEILEQNFSDSCKVLIKIPIDRQESFFSSLKNFYNLNITEKG